MHDPPASAEIVRRDTLLGDAVAILGIHVPDSSGWCAGCLEQWDRLIPHASCTQSSWAVAVVESHGALGDEAVRLHDDDAQPSAAGSPKLSPLRRSGELSHPTRRPTLD